ncbi:MAG: MMPL family transporter, partial [Myxococcota bacterium]
AVDGTIHMLARFREELTAQNGDVDEALIQAARGTGKAIILTCLSLMFGFGVMLWSSFPPVRRFGELIAVTVFGCLLATIVVLPPLLRVGTPNSPQKG